MHHRSGDRPDAYAACLYSVASNRSSNANPDAPASNTYRNAYSAADSNAKAIADGNEYTDTISHSNGHSVAFAHTISHGNGYAISNTNEYTHAVTHGHDHPFANRYSHCDTDSERDRYRRVIAHQPDHSFFRSEGIVRANRSQR